MLAEGVNNEDLVCRTDLNMHCMHLNMHCVEAAAREIGGHRTAGGDSSDEARKEDTVVSTSVKQEWSGKKKNQSDKSPDLLPASEVDFWLESSCSG